MQWAEALRRLGIRAGDRVAISLPDGIEALAVRIGVAWLPATTVPLPFELAHDEAQLNSMLAQTGARALVCSPDHRDALVSIKPPGLRTVIFAPNSGLRVSGVDTFGADDVLEDVQGHEFRGPADHDIAAIAYTSGSTGAPKGALVHWRQLCLGTKRHWCGDVDELREQYRFYWPIPLTWSPTSVTLQWIAYVGACVVISKLNPRTYLDEIEEFGCTGAFVSNGLMQYLTHRERSAASKARTLRYVTVNGPILACVDQFVEIFGVKASTAYGMTELPSFLLSSDGFTLDNSYAGGCCGYANRDEFELRVVDANDEPVPDGQPGELTVRSSLPWTISTGYIGMPAESSKAWRNGWFHTGDVFVREEDGRFHFFGRHADMLQTEKGVISSAKVETAAKNHPDVLEAVLVACADVRGGVLRVLFAVKWKGSALAAQELLSYMSGWLPEGHAPDRVMFLDRLPTTQTGKVDLQTLRTKATIDDDGGVASRESHEQGPHANAAASTPMR
jgi:crotonobetaine/carnitine-CoA ligase